MLSHHLQLGLIVASLARSRVASGHAAPVRGSQLRHHGIIHHPIMPHAMRPRLETYAEMADAAGSDKAVAADLKTEKDPLVNRSIWNGTWVSFTFWHPGGVLSNVFDGQVVWADVGYINLGQVIKLSLVAYPGALLPLALLGALAVGLLLEQRNPSEVATLAERSIRNCPGPPEVSGGNGPPAAYPSELTVGSQSLYRYWCSFCCALPSVMVFGVPLLLVYFSYFWPQEVFTITLIISSAFVFMNGMYMVFFTPFALSKMQRNMGLSPAEVLENVRADVLLSITHWVIFPNYKEDADVMEAAMSSVAKSTLAKAQIGVILAMEEREGAEGQAKANELKAKLSGLFLDFVITFHPSGLPNDPPGKASNVSYAFKWLAQRVSDREDDTSKVIVTVADADSEFHSNYFELLTRQYLDADPAHCKNYLWQSSVLHMKNYHRQPGPVLVGTMFTAMAEISCLADPTATRLPYSTYSLTMALANEVGGWDPEWIAEDWHMGIKCFLMTLGRATVQPVLLPTINYTPEADTWTNTLAARFSQAKRHALGFSDLAYFFMMLPLICARVSSGRHPGASMADFWRLLFSGMPFLIKFVNTHVVIGIMVSYALLDATLKKVMYYFLAHSISGLFERTFFASAMFSVASFTLTLVVTFAYQALYRFMRSHLEEPTPGMWTRVFDNVVAHTLTTVVCFTLCGPLYFIGLAYAVWEAALKLLFTRTFVYEVAAKPTKECRLTETCMG